jgi:catechol O-methyltransferase
MLDATSSPLAHAAQNVVLIALSLAFLPLDSFVLGLSIVLGLFMKSWAEKHRRDIRSPHTSIRDTKTILVTGVGMTKGLALARTFFAAGHNVIGADFEPLLLPVSCGRTSKALKAFHRLDKPGAEGSEKYIQSILDIIRKESVDIWVSCSGVASAIEDGEAKEMIERITRCKAIQFDVATTKKLHEKHSFIEHTKSIGLPTPDTHTITSKAAALKMLDEAAARKGKRAGMKYIMKYIGTDDSVRADMTLLPFDTPAATKAHISRLPISEDRPWILQQYISGPEYCTHALVIRGEVKVFVACPSAELLMHYEALPATSGLSQSMLRFTQEYAAAGGDSFTGHLSFDFLVEMSEAEAGLKDPTHNVQLYPIECNPRAHTAVALFNETPEMANAYITLLRESPEDRNEQRRKHGLTNGNASQPVFPNTPTKKYYWVGHDLAELVLLPLLALFTPGSGMDLSQLSTSVSTFVDHLLFWKDGTFEVWDPWPAFWLYHVYWPAQFVLAILQGKKWSRLNVSTTKMFMC